MESVLPTPILIFGFNRPKSLSSLLRKLEGLQNREVWVSIDGPRDGDDFELIAQCLDLSRSWSQISKHSIKVIEHRNNLGLYQHFILMLEAFFDTHEFGIILEDDMEFRKSFISFVDENKSKLASGEYWSICGHNPISDFNHLPINETILFEHTYVHTIWGWATHRNSIRRFLEIIDEPDFRRLITSIKRGANSITRDPFLRKGIERVWQFKISRAAKSDLRGGWDNYWVIAGWDSGLPSLMPNYSLSRENPIQLEGQSHFHLTKGKAWIEESDQVEDSVKILSNSKTNDAPKMRVWGISRLYTWVFALRILNWKIDASN